MFVEELRRAVLACQRGRLAEISATVWKGFAAGALAESDAQSLAELIEARKVMPAAPSQPRRVGSRPRSPESTERRRRASASGWLPPQLACRFTLAELAVLSIVAERVARYGHCDATVGEIAGRAGCCATVVRNALRQARRLGLGDVEARRIAYDRNRSNVVRIVSAEWSTWLRMRSRKVDRGGWVQNRVGHAIHIDSGSENRAAVDWKTGLTTREVARIAPYCQR